MKPKCIICNDTGYFTNPFDQEFKCKCIDKAKRRAKKPTYCESTYIKPCMIDAIENKDFETKCCKQCYYYNKVSK